VHWQKKMFVPQEQYERIEQEEQSNQKERGDLIDYCTDGKFFVAKWHDNSIVSMASNWETQQSLAQSELSGKRRQKGGYTATSDQFIQ